MRAPIPGYERGYRAGIAAANAGLVSHGRHWARLELARLRKFRPTRLRDDYGWGFKDGSATTLANYLYLT